MNLPPNNKVNPSWTSARALPARRSVYEPITYDKETGFFRENVPSPWDEKLSEHFNYGELPPQTVRYSTLERQPGQNGWSKSFTGVDDQMVMQSSDLNAYNFEQPNYNRYKPPARQAAIVDDADNWEPWNNPPVVSTPSPVESSAAIALPPPRRAAIGDDIDLSDLGLFDDVIPEGKNLTASIPDVTPHVTLTVVDPYDFESSSYTYRPEDDIQNFRSGIINAKQVSAQGVLQQSNQPIQPPVLRANRQAVLQPTPQSTPQPGGQLVVTQPVIKLNPYPIPRVGGWQTQPPSNSANDSSWWNRFKSGFTGGNSFGVGDRANREYDPSGKAYFAKSAIFDRAPEELYKNLDTVGQVGFIGGRVASDIYGNGTRKHLWNIQPEDFTNTEGKRMMNEAGLSRTAQLLIPYAANIALGVGSGNYDPTNVGEGGRPQGFAAVNPGDDPRQSTSPVYDMAIERGMLGRRGRLLPWEQFHQERPDISFEQYDKYTKYLGNKDENVLRKMTGGLAKGTLDGINGPEVNVMGYSVNPIGAAAAAGIILLGRQGKLIK